MTLLIIAVVAFWVVFLIGLLMMLDRVERWAGR
jgi:hypothetical protein